MIYPYRCTSCGHTFEVIKAVRYIDDLEPCVNCESNATVREIAKRQFFYGAGDWNTQTFNPGLGCYTKSNAHARKIAKSKGLEEVGNESCEKIEAHYDKMRETKREQNWNDALREKVYE